MTVAGAVDGALPSDRAANPKIVYSVQILRGMAAMLVVLHHVALYLSLRTGGDTFEPGAAGVDIFFVISGFVIYLTGRKLVWSEFAGRRIARIVPLYWLFLTLKLGFVAVAGAEATRGVGGLAYVAASYLFVPAYHDGLPMPLILAAWTLNFEMYFYLVCTMVLMTLPRARFVAGVTAIIAGMTSAGLATTLAAPGVVPPAPAILLNPLCFEFIAGMLLAVAWCKGLFLPRVPAALAVAIGIAWIAFMPVPSMFSPVRPLAWGVGAVAIAAGSVSLERAVAFRRWVWALVLGDASYALYLSHTVALPVLGALALRLHLPWWTAFVILAAACVAIGVACHYWLERFLLRFASRLLRLQAREPAPKSI